MDTNTTVFLSKKGLKQLKKEIAQLEREHKEVFAELREIDRTDSHEERLQRAEKLSRIELIESELADKKHLVATAKILPRKRDVLKVALGSVVDLIDTNGRIVRYTIVDSHEVDPSAGRISTLSPLGRSLIGKQMKDIVEWSTGLATKRLQLVSIA